MASFSTSDLSSAFKKAFNFSKEELYLGGLLTQILTRHEIVSVSFINTQMRGKNKSFFVSFEFLKKTNFRLFIIGSDLKISQAMSDERFIGFNKSDDFYNQLVSILDKDHSAFVQLKKRLIEHNEVAKLQDQVLKWSSNKFKFNLPFLLRNSHKFEIYMENNVSYIRLAEVHQKDMRIEISEKEIWEMVNRNESDLVVDCLSKFLSKIDFSVNQGTLQSCLDYGSCAIDKGFMQRNSSLFVINTADNSIALKGSNSAGGINQQTYKDIFFKSSPSKSTPSPSPKNFNVEPFTTSPTSNSYNPMRNDLFIGASSLSSQNTNSNTNLRPGIQERIEKAYADGQTVVILGNNSKLPAIFIDNENSSALSNLEMVVAVKQQIASEIETRSFK